MAEEKKNNTKRFYWLKLPNDYFKRLDQRKMYRQPNGESMQRIYLKMLLLAVDKGGFIRFQNVFDDLTEEIAEEIFEDIVILADAEYRAGGYGGIIPRGVSEVLKQRKNKKGTYPEWVERKEAKIMTKFKEMTVAPIAKSIDEEIQRDMDKRKAEKMKEADANGEFLKGFGVQSQETNPEYYEPEEVTEEEREKISDISKKMGYESSEKE